MKTFLVILHRELGVYTAHIRSTSMFAAICFAYLQCYSVNDSGERVTYDMIKDKKLNEILRRTYPGNQSVSRIDWPTDRDWTVFEVCEPFELRIAKEFDRFQKFSETKNELIQEFFVAD